MKLLGKMSAFLMIAVLIFSCGSDSAEKPKNQFVQDSEGTVEAKPPKKESPQLNYSKLPVPDACTLLSPEDIQEILGIDATEIQVKDGSHPSSPYARACFFKWISDSRPNAGMLVQAQVNPVGDEFPTWATSFIESKRTGGESDFSGTGEVYKYTKLEGIGDDGSYSYELGKYLWRTGNEYVYMIAFNEDMGDSEQLAAVMKFADKIMQRVEK